MTPSKWSRACGGCWRRKHKCQKDNPGRCSACIDYLVDKQIDDQSSIKLSPQFDYTVLYELLLRTPPPGSSASLDTQGQDSSSFTYIISPSTGVRINFSHNFCGPYTIQNRSVVEAIDGLVKKFSAQIADKAGRSKLLPSASLAGGYIRLLCNVTDVTEQVTTLQDGFEALNQYRGYNLEAQFKYLLVCRLWELINKVLGAIRSVGPSNDDPSESSNAYAAAVILRCDLDHFKRYIRNGSLPNNVAAELTRILSGWFGEVERELMDRIREGCARFPRWMSVVNGSMKKFRSQNDRKETFAVTMQLQLQMSNLSMMSRDSFHTSQDDCQTLQEDFLASQDAFYTQDSFCALQENLVDSQNKSHALREGLVDSQDTLFASRDAFQTSQDISQNDLTQGDFHALREEFLDLRDNTFGSDDDFRIPQDVFQALQEPVDSQNNFYASQDNFCILQDGCDTSQDGSDSTRDNHFHVSQDGFYASQYGTQAAFRQSHHTLKADCRIMFPMMPPVLRPSPANFTRFMFPAPNYYVDESAESSFSVYEPVTSAPQGPLRSLNSGAIYVGRMSDQASEQVPHSPSSGYPDSIHCLDPTYLSSPDWYQVQSSF